MNRARIWTRALAVAALAALPALGCTAQAKKDRSAEERETPPSGRPEGSDEAPSASEAARDVKDAAQDAAGTVDAAKQVADVKLALMADPGVDASGINVDADEATKTIHLKGTVPAAAQKAVAERIARDKAEGWKIHNMLTVGKKS
jgi:BON domain-containing protein